jgi:hypothetical protein
MVNFAQIGTTAAAAVAAVAPFIIAASPAGALADECKKAPAPSRAYITDLSTPVLIADASPAVAQAQPNCPPPDDAVTIVQRQNQRIIDAKRDLRETLRNRPPIPGS